MTNTLPHMSAYGNVTKCLEKIINAQTPTTFSQDYLASTLKLTGGGARPVIKFLKNLGFLSDSGEPTEIYHQFRIDSTRGKAAAQSLKIGYSELFKQNEYIYNETDNKIKEAIIATLQCGKSDLRIQKILKCFNNVKAFANFDQLNVEPAMQLQSSFQSKNQNQAENLEEALKSQDVALNLAYTVNLNLPESTNSEVFNAIFKSLKDNLLKND